MKRGWHEEDPALIKDAPKIPDALKENNTNHEGKNYGRRHRTQRSKRPTNHTTPFSEFESRFGRHADPLYSIHETTPRLSGVDPSNLEYVFVDPHVLATPTISDTDGDGIYAELIVPISYYFDPHHYGDQRNLDSLNGLGVEDLINYVGGGVVIVDLRSGEVIGEKLLGITRATDDQPGYILATPTVVRLKEGDFPIIVIGSAMGKLHMLSGNNLEDMAGFPLTFDSLTAQVAVGDIFGNGKLDLVVGDYSGNVYCVDGKGVRVWEKELGEGISAAVRLVDLEGDGTLEVVVVTKSGSMMVLNGQTGADWSSGFLPMHLNTGVESPVLVMHMTSRERGKVKQEEPEGSRGSVAVVLGTADGLYIVDTQDGCLEHIPVQSHMIHEVLSGDVDPYNPGLELITVGLDGTLICFKTTIADQWAEKEAWSMEATGPSFFTHKDSSFYFIVNSSSEVTGKNFDLSLTLYANHFKSENMFNISVSIGMKHELHHQRTTVLRRKTDLDIRLPSPPTPLSAFLTVHVCSQHQQCRSKYIHIRFNLHFEDHLQWFLCLPFLSLCGLILWVHRRDGATLSLPTSSRSGKRTSGTRKDL